MTRLLVAQLIVNVGQLISIISKHIAYVPGLVGDNRIVANTEAAINKLTATLYATPPPLVPSIVYTLYQ